MQPKNILQKDYTINQKFYQLKFPLNIDYMIPANDSVRLLSQFVEEMDLKDLYSTYSRVRENQVSPRKMLKIMIYGYMNKLYSSRDIENACRRDINFMFLFMKSVKFQAKLYLLMELKQKLMQINIHSFGKKLLQKIWQNY